MKGGGCNVAVFAIPVLGADVSGESVLLRRYFVGT